MPFLAYFQQPLANSHALDNICLYSTHLHASVRALLAAAAMTAFCAVPARSQIYVSNQNNQTLGEYDLSTGSPIKSTLVTGLSNPAGVALGTSNNFVYVVNNGNATVSKYNSISGAAVSFNGSSTNTITGFTNPMGLTFATVTLSGTSTPTLFVGDNNTAAGMGTVSKYNPSTGQSSRSPMAPPP